MSSGNNSRKQKIAMGNKYNIVNPRNTHFGVKQIRVRILGPGMIMSELLKLLKSHFPSKNIFKALLELLKNLNHRREINMGIYIYSTQLKIQNVNIVYYMTASFITTEFLICTIFLRIKPLTNIQCATFIKYLLHLSENSL